MIQKPRGTQDIFFEKAEKLNFLNNQFCLVLKRYGFSEIITPIFESKEVFVRSVGDETDIVQKEMYEFKDKKGREFVLRPELTAPVVRSIIENKLYLENNLPLKFFYNGPVFRYERPQFGRYRQFNQFGVEIFGNDFFEQDVEVILLAKELLKSCEINENISFNLNYLPIGEFRIKYEKDLFLIIDKMNDLCADCNRRKNKNILRVLDCKIDELKFLNLPKMSSYIPPEDKKRFNETIQELESNNVKIFIDEKLVRGLDYYTGLVFEIKNVKTNQTVIAGGRYNDLVEKIGGPKLPAIGFGVGVERIIDTIEENNISLFEDGKIDLFIIPLSNKARNLTNKLLFEIRSKGLVGETNWSITNLKNGFKASDKKNVENILVIGDKDIVEDTYFIKSKTKKDTNIKVNYKDIIKTLLEIKGK